MPKVEFGRNSKLKTIEKYAFFTSSLTSIDIPGEVTFIGEYCFAECRELYSITIAASHRKIKIEVGPEAFAEVHCPVIFPEEVEVVQLPSASD